MNVKVVLWLVVLVGFAAALYSAAVRWKTETRNRSVEITLDYNEVRAIALSERKPVSDVLRRFKQAGVTSISLQEETIGSLEEARVLRVERVADSSSALLLSGYRNDSTVFYTSDTPTRDRVYGAVMQKMGLPVTSSGKLADRSGRTPSLRTPDEYPLVVDVPYITLRGLGVGLNPDILTEIREAGLEVVGRVANYNGVHPSGIHWELNELKRQGIKTVIFAGDEMLGYRGYLVDDPKQPSDTSTAKALQDAPLWVGVVEFGKQKGEIEISKGADDRVVRVHTVTGAEMLLANVPTNVQRFTLAARERNIRLLYIRLFTDEKGLLEYNAEYIEKVVKGLERGNLVPGIAHGYGELTTPVGSPGTELEFAL